MTTRLTNVPLIESRYYERDREHSRPKLARSPPPRIARQWRELARETGSRVAARVKGFAARSESG